MACRQSLPLEKEDMDSPKIDVIRREMLDRVMDRINRSVNTRRGTVLAVKSNGHKSCYIVSIQCANGHTFDQSTKNLWRGCWCAGCSEIEDRIARAGVLKRAQDLARNRGGDCISTEYINARRQLHWRCLVGHEWFALMDNVKNKGSWCPECATALRRRSRKTLRTAPGVRLGVAPAPGYDSV